MQMFGKGFQQINWNIFIWIQSHLYLMSKIDYWLVVAKIFTILSKFLGVGFLVSLYCLILYLFFLRLSSVAEPCNGILAIRYHECFSKIRGVHFQLILRSKQIVKKPTPDCSFISTISPSDKKESIPFSSTIRNTAELSIVRLPSWSVSEKHPTLIRRYWFSGSWLGCLFSAATATKTRFTTSNALHVDGLHLNFIVSIL